MNRIRTIGNFALPITVAMLLTLGTHGAEPSAVDYTFRLIDSAEDPLPAPSGRLVVKKSERAKEPRTSVFVRVQGKETSPAPSKSTVVKALNNLTPKTPRKQAEPSLYVPPFIKKPLTLAAPKVVPVLKPAPTSPPKKLSKPVPQVTRIKQRDTALVTPPTARQPGTEQPKAPAARIASRAKSDRRTEAAGERSNARGPLAFLRAQDQPTRVDPSEPETFPVLSDVPTSPPPPPASPKTLATPKTLASTKPPESTKTLAPPKKTPVKPVPQMSVSRSQTTLTPNPSSTTAGLRRKDGGVLPLSSKRTRSQPPNDVNVAPRVARRYNDGQPLMPAETIEAPVVVDETEGVLSRSVASGSCGCPYFPTQSGAKTICGVDCSNCRAPFDSRWRDARPIPWSIFGQGEYVGPPRTEHTFQYFLRVNDELEIVYFLSREKTSQPYRLAVGDQVRIESLTDATIDRQVEIQPDGFIALPQIGEVLAAGKTVKELRDAVQELYTTVQRNPQITVTPVLFNVVLQDIVNAVDRRGGIGGQSQPVRVTPEGTLQVPGLKSIYVQGLSLDELKRELEVRYQAVYGPGLNITPILVQRAPTFVFVGGEVRSPGRYTLEGPTTVMQAISLAGGWNVGGNTNQVVVFRRDDNWCLKATKIDLFRPLYGKDPCPVNDVWIRDNDLVIVPKRAILVADDIIELYMTRGVYSAFPVGFFYNLSQGSVLSGAASP